MYRAAAGADRAIGAARMAASARGIVPGMERRPVAPDVREAFHSELDGEHLHHYRWGIGNFLI